MSLDYNEKNITLAKNLRKNATSQENHLWYDFLSKYEIRFQRQKAIDNFIADFYCHKAKLIIEIDGAQHYTEEGRQKDEFRTEILEGYDLKVIRFTNRQISTNFRGVCEYIDAAVKASLRERGRGTALAVEGACVTLGLDKSYCIALSLSRLRRQLPPGGSLWVLATLGVWTLPWSL